MGGLVCEAHLCVGTFYDYFVDDVTCFLAVDQWDGPLDIKPDSNAMERRCCYETTIEDIAVGSLSEYVGDVLPKHGSIHEENEGFGLLEFAVVHMLRESNRIKT